MMLHQTCYASRAGVPEDCHWAMAGLGGKIRLHATRAILEDIGYEPAFVGVPSPFIRDVGSRAGASDAQIEAALQAAAITTAESSNTLAFIVAAVLVALLAVLFAARLRLRA